ncbi:MAG: hypothetical protein WA419_14060, partial [Silvibacterium sp.]
SYLVYGGLSGSNRNRQSAQNDLSQSGTKSAPTNQSPGTKPQPPPVAANTPKCADPSATISGLSMKRVGTAFETANSCIDIRNSEVTDALIGVKTTGEPQRSSLPAARIDDAQKKVLASCLATHPGSVGISSISEVEASTFAKDWLEVFQSAHWMIDGGEIRTIPASTATPGIEFHVYVLKGPDGKMFSDPETPSGAAADCIIHKQFSGGGRLVPAPEVAPDHLEVIVGQEVQP